MRILLGVLLLVAVNAGNLRHGRAQPADVAAVETIAKYV